MAHAKRQRGGRDTLRVRRGDSATQFRVALCRPSLNHGVVLRRATHPPAPKRCSTSTDRSTVASLRRRRRRLTRGVFRARRAGAPIALSRSRRRRRTEPRAASRFCRRRQYIYGDFKPEIEDVYQRYQPSNSIFRGVDRIKLIMSIIESPATQDGCGLNLTKLTSGKTDNEARETLFLRSRWFRRRSPPLLRARAPCGCHAPYHLSISKQWASWWSEARYHVCGCVIGA